MEKIEFKIEPNDEGQVILREGDAAKIIEAKTFLFAGDIRAVAEWIKTKSDEIDLLRAVVKVSLDAGCIWLHLNNGQENGRIESTVTAKLYSFPDLDEFRINTGYSWELNTLGNHCKFNRRYFLDKSTNMDIVAGLKSFKAQVSREIEKAADDRGNHRRLDDKKVATNLPEVFTLYMPLFKGEPFTDVDVEIIIEEREGVARVQLSSVSLLEKREAYIRQAIDEQIKQFKDTGITIIYD